MADKFDVPNFEKFVNEFKNGDLKAYVKSEPIPENNDGPVKITKKPMPVEVPHLRYLQLIAYSSFAQHTLQKLLKCLTFDTVLQKPALDELFQIQEKDLMNIPSIGRNIVFLRDNSAISTPSIVIEKLDTCALVSLLQQIKNLPTSFKREEIPCKDNEHNENSRSCTYCDEHKCSNCDVQPYKCKHRSKECRNEAMKNCNLYKNACCKDCQLCWYCFVAKHHAANLHPVKNMDEFIEMVAGNDKEICPKQELRIAISILLKFRNIVVHLSHEELLEMDKGTYTNKKEHFSDKNWKWFEKTYHYAIKVVLKYLNNAQYIESKIKLLLTISTCQNNNDLVKQYGVETERYLVQEKGSDYFIKTRWYVKEWLACSA